MRALEWQGVRNNLGDHQSDVSAQAIRKANDLAWKPLQFLTYTSQSISAVLEPAGLENAIGILSGSFAKDPTDPTWKDDPDMKERMRKAGHG